MPRSWRWFLLSAAVIILDYLTKVAVLAAFAPGEGRALTSFFNLVLVFNKWDQLILDHQLRFSQADHLRSLHQSAVR